MDEHMSYIGRCKGCGRVVCAVIDNPDHAKRVAKEVAKFIRYNLIIERVESAYVRENFQSCACGKKKASAQLPLFAEDGDQ